jgi:hypothetical protein
MPKIGLTSLKQILQNSVCEIRFTKRRPELTGQSVRTMLCTLDSSILNSVNGRTSLNFKPTSNPPKYNPESKNLLLVWDIFMQDWRMVSMDNCDLITSIPNDEFWEYFNDTIRSMTIQEKNQFMGR